MLDKMHLNIAVKFSKEDLKIESKLNDRINELSNAIDEAIKNRSSIYEFQKQRSDLIEELRTLKGHIMFDDGYRKPKNSTELAEQLMLKAKQVSHLEIEHLNSILNNMRNEILSTKNRIEGIIEFCIEHKLNEKFEDFENAIKCWEYEKADIFDKPERCEPSFGTKNIPMLTPNIIGYYTQSIRKIQFMIGDVNVRISHETQVDALISACKAVMSCEDDNVIFGDIFLMGQYAGNLNSIKLNIDASIADERSRISAASKSNWVHELVQQVYLDFWIYGQLPTADEVIKKYPQLVGERTTRTVSDQLTKQRKIYSLIDKKVPPVNAKGRNKKV